MPESNTNPLLTLFTESMTGGVLLTPEQRDVITTCFHEVIHAWTEPHRVYHSLSNHLIPLLDRINNTLHEPYTGRVAIMGAFYHDVVMKPGVKDSTNVETSAALWDHHYNRLTEFCSPDFGMDVFDAIMSTRYDLPQDEVNNTLLRSCDLMGLAQPWTEYVRVGTQIEQESSCPPRPVERARWLLGLLSSPRIFRAGSVWDQLELTARDNLSRDLAMTLTANPDVFNL